MKKSKQARALPTRGGLYDLDKTGRTIVDYAKALPTDQARPTPSVMQNLAPPKLRK